MEEKKSSFKVFFEVIIKITVTVTLLIAVYYGLTMVQKIVIHKTIELPQIDINQGNN